MVPLHAAYRLHQPAWQFQFRNHVERFLAAYPTDFAPALLSQVHYLYFVARFAVLASEAGQSLPVDLVAVLERFVEEKWLYEPAWRREGGFYSNARERVLTVLTSDDWTVNAHNALIDDDYFLFAIAADLKRVRQFRQAGPSPTLDEVMTIAERAIRARIVWNLAGGWLLEPCVMDDHEEYLYAGQPLPFYGMQPIPVPGIAFDSSHAHRWPLMLYSLAAAAGSNQTRRFYDRLQKGLEKQFAHRCSCHPTKMSLPGGHGTSWTAETASTEPVSALSGCRRSSQPEAGGVFSDRSAFRTPSPIRPLASRWHRPSSPFTHL
jgi:hypothetical protein